MNSAFQIPRTSKVLSIPLCASFGRPLVNALNLLAVLTLLCCVRLPAAAALIDWDGDGASDFWQAIYQLPSLDPAEDNDGDGLSNGIEEIAGTDPLKGDSVFAIFGFEVGESATGAAEATVQFGGIGGKSYQLQGTGGLQDRRWQDLGAAISAKESGRIQAKIALERRTTLGF